MDNTFNTSSELLSRDRGHIQPDELLRLRIVCTEPLEKIHDGTTGTEQHIMIHDRWLGHIEMCDICKEHVLLLFMDLNKRINLFTPTMLGKLMRASPEHAKAKFAELPPELRDKLKQAVSG